MRSARLGFCGFAIGFLACYSAAALSATYDMTAGQYPPCSTNWSVSGSVYTCQGNGRVTLGSGDVLVSSTDITVSANNGFGFSAVTVGDSNNRIDLNSQYGSIDIDGPSTVYGDIEAASSNIDLEDTDVVGPITTGGSIVTDGGSVSGTLTSTGNTITTNNTDLSGGATAQSGMSISGGIISGDFEMTSNNQAIFSGVEMESGSITGASRVEINNSTLGSPNSMINIESESNEIEVNDSTVYGRLEAPSYSEVDVNNSDIYGECLPRSNPENACNSAAEPSVLEGQWYFDESSWVGSTGEVEDTSGNSNDGTASGDANTNDTNPAIPGNPGTCRYGMFDGDGDYITVPGLSDVLNDTASLAFWIKTTQSGNNTAWQAPGVAGAELSGGTDDIFWGWIDATGHIGIAVGNDNSASSSTIINNGAWHHVALTRNQQTGDYKIYVDGNLESTGTMAAGVIGNSYSRLGRVEDTGGTPVDFDGELDEVHLYSGVLTDGDVSDLMSQTHPCGQQLCPSATAQPRLLGRYYDTQNLDDVRNDPPTATRVDGPIEFTWNGSDGPSVLGQGNDFSILWNGRLLVTETGNYEFSVVSDDGVRLILDGQTIINEWNDQDDTRFDSPNQQLEAGQVYDIQLEHYENDGDADIELYWSRRGGGPPMTRQLIPAGNSQGTARGLYHCPSTAVAYYTLDSNSPGLTCEAQPVTITARDSDGNAMIPESGTEIELGVSPGTSGATWVGGDFYTFSGAEPSVIRYLTHSDSTIDVTPEVAETNGSASGVGSAIDFVDVALRFYGNSNVIPTPPPIPNQVAAVEDSAPVVRVVRTDDETGACEAAMTDQDRAVDLAFECRNPDQCIAGETLTLEGSAVAANDLNTGPAYTSVTLGFDSQGFAPISVNYSDVGRVRLHGRISVPVENDSNREVTLTAQSNEFVVKPYTLAVAAVNRSDGSSNPTTTGSGDGFVAAGQAFEVVVESCRKCEECSECSVTPNYGNEDTPQAPRLDESSLSVEYPSGGVTGTLSGADAFSAVSGNTGQFRNTEVSWNEVGTFTVIPRLQGDDYLGAGDLFETTRSGNIGRFYPQVYQLTDDSVTDSCTDTLPFTYMDEPGIAVDYTLEARNVVGNRVQNYDEALGYAVADETYDYENSGECLPSLGSCDGGARLTLSQAPAWQNGRLDVTETATFARGSAPEAPLDALQLALSLTDDPDNRPISGLDINPETSGDCTSGGNCTMKALGGLLDLRYGRLKLGSAYGPEILDLPVDMATQYYDGSRWVTNKDDGCTAIPATDIFYQSFDVNSGSCIEPGTPISDSLEAPVGDATGVYADLGANEVGFSEGDAGHFFTASQVAGKFCEKINLSDELWLQFDWDRNGANETSVTGTYQFGSYRGHDRIIYWREVLD